MARRKRDRGGKTYGARDVNLRTIGFASYADYLASPLWQAIRARFIGKGRQCLRCGRPATEVHHKRYSVDVLRGASSGAGLIAVCHECHKRCEFREDGSKVTLKEANSRLFHV